MEIFTLLKDYAKVKFYYTTEDLVEDIKSYFPDIHNKDIHYDIFIHLKFKLFQKDSNIFNPNSPFNCIGIKLGDKYLPCFYGQEESGKYFLDPIYAADYLHCYLQLQKYFTENNSEVLGEHIYYPIVKKSNKSFREFLKTDIHNNVIPHFYGEKSKRIQWKFVFGEEVKTFREQTIFTWFEHCNDYYKRFPINTTREMITKDWLFNPREETYVIAAFDNVKYKYIGGMVCEKIGDCLHLGSPAFPKSDEYKPYSLMTCAHIAAIRGAFFTEENIVNIPGINIIDLGINFNDCAQYKNTIQHEKIHLRNFKTFNNEQEFLNILDQI